MVRAHIMCDMKYVNTLRKGEKGKRLMEALKAALGDLKGWRWNP